MLNGNDCFSEPNGNWLKICWMKGLRSSLRGSAPWAWMAGRSWHDCDYSILSYSFDLCWKCTMSWCRVAFLWVPTLAYFFICRTFAWCAYIFKVSFSHSLRKQLTINILYLTDSWRYSVNFINTFINSKSTSYRHQPSGQFGGVKSTAAFWQLHKLVPIESFLPATSPILLQVVEHRLPLVEMTRVFVVFLFYVLLSAALVHALELATFRFE